VRKWIRVAAALLLLLAVFLVPLNEIEVHKRRCQAAWDRLNGKSMTERVKRVYYKVTKTKPSANRWSDNYRDWESSREALVQLGYLQRQRMRLNYISDATVENELLRTGLVNAFTWSEGRWDNSVVIVAPRIELAKVTNWVLSIDVPPNVDAITK
jgi:hypothetical protein